MDLEDEQDGCAVCGIKEGDSSNLTQSQTLLINGTVGCGHKFCESCVDRELSLRKVFHCPTCDTAVRREKLSNRTLDDLQCERDAGWRKKVLEVYNKVEKDFPTLMEYNNYLEEVEDIIFAIVNEEPNAEECIAKFRKYEEEHKAEIASRQSERADEDRTIEARIAEEQRNKERRKRDLLEGEKAVRAAKRRYKLEATQVSLGDREEVSKELVAAQMTGYRNEILKAQRGRPQGYNLNLPRVREPPGGPHAEKKLDRELYLKRQAAGGGIPSNSLVALERNWVFAVNTLFTPRKQASVQ